MKKNTDNYIELFKEFSSKYIFRIDSFVDAYYKKKIEGAPEHFMGDMYGAICEYCLREGKRIRPLLLINAYLGYKKIFNRTEEIVKLGAAIEMMHSLLLIQDDLIDKSSLRRGGKALHLLMEEKYRSFTHNPLIGSDIAIVLSDIIFSNALEIISGVNINLKVKNTFLEIFSSTYEKTAWGQILDSLNTLPCFIDIDKNYPMQISMMKTAYYTIVYPLMMGYVLSGKNKKDELKRIEEFAMPLGIAFQMKDDLLGAFGIEKETGKSNDSDIIEGKLTLLVQNTLACLSEKEREIFMGQILSQNKSQNDVEFIRSRIRESGAFQETLKVHSELIVESRSKLEYMSIGRSNRRILMGVIDSIGHIPDLV